MKSLMKVEDFEKCHQTKYLEQRPWMKAAEITDKLIDAIKSGSTHFW